MHERASESPVLLRGYFTAPFFVVHKLKSITDQFPFTADFLTPPFVDNAIKCGKQKKC